MRDHIKPEEKVIYLPLKSQYIEPSKTQIIKEMLVFSALIVLVLAIAMVFGA